MRKVGIYIRVSTEEQAKVDEGSIKNQTHGLRKYVEAENLKEDGKWGIIADEYVDDGYSGKNLNRPELRRLLKDILNKKIDTVIMTEISRLSRSVKNWCDLREFFKEHDAIFIVFNNNNSIT
jgi:site-specific DNA recombinase